MAACLRGARALRALERARGGLGCVLGVSSYHARAATKSIILKGAHGAPSPPELADDAKHRGSGGTGGGSFDVLNFSSVAAAAAVAGVVITCVTIFETSVQKRARTEVEAILAARVRSPEADTLETYVERPELEAELKSFVQEPITANGKYMVVVGARGAGKTTLVEHVLSKMDGGVLVVPLGEAASPPFDLDGLIVQAALKQYKPRIKSPYATSKPLEGGYLAERLEAAAEARGEAGWRPTLVLDMTLSGNGPLIRAACARAKMIGSDRTLGHVIIVLSSSFAVAELPSDRARQRFLCVGALSDDEASAQLDANFKALPKDVATSAAVAALKARVLPLTTLPVRMCEVAEGVRGSRDEAEFGARAEAWASGFEGAARKEVAAAQTDVLHVFLRDKGGKEYCLTTSDLMRALLDAGGPVKLPATQYRVPAEVFASKIRESNAAKGTFHVDLVAETVDFASDAHRQAAAELLGPPTPSGLFGACVTLWRAGRRL